MVWKSCLALVIAVLMWLGESKEAKLIAFGAKDEYLWKYFNGVNDQYYVELGHDQNSRLNTAIFKNWKGLSISYSKPIDSTNQNRFENSNINNYLKIQNTTLTFTQICKKYYLKRPKLLLIYNQKLTDQYIHSNIWQFDQCVPKIIYAKEQTENEQLWKKLNYFKHKVVEGYAFYIHQQFQYSILANYQKNHQLNTYNNLTTWEQLESKVIHPITNRQIGPNGKIHIYEVQNTVVSITNIIDQYEFTGLPRNQPIFIINLNPKNNILIIGTANYEIKDQNLNGFVLKTIIIKPQNKKIFILLNQIEYISIYQENINPNITHIECEDYIIQHVSVKIRNIQSTQPTIVIPVIPKTITSVAQTQSVQNEAAAESNEATAEANEVTAEANQTNLTSQQSKNKLNQQNTLGLVLIFILSMLIVAALVYFGFKRFKTTPNLKTNQIFTELPELVTISQSQKIGSLQIS